jgi:poly(3-hydroxybutyrate) depolymerase
MRKFTYHFLFALLCVCLLPFYALAQENIQVGTTTRTMIVYAPTGIAQNRPLLISLHGMNQDAAYQKSQAKWEPIADTAKFVVVFPNGINNSWDLSGTSDIDLIKAVIDAMNSRYGIDRNRVYLSGFSMGGMMTYFAATKIADKIAAFAPISGYLMGGPNTNSSRPIPIIHTHGDADDVVAYSGVQTCLNAWITRNGCPATAQVTKPYPSSNPNSIATKSYWGPGTNGVEIVLMTLSGKGHWISIDPVNGINTSAEIWKFCRKYSLGSASTSSITIEENTTGFCSVDGSVASSNSGYTGAGYADTNSATGAGVSWSVNIPSAGTYTLKWRYASTSSRPANLKVNGTTVVSNLAFASTGSWTTWVTTGTTSVSLAAGTRVIRLEATTSAGLGNIDNMTITGISPTAVACTGVKSEVADMETDGTMSLSPNPLRGGTLQIRSAIHETSDVSITVYNGMGQVVLKKNYGTAEAGLFEKTLDLSNLSKGTYIVRLQANAKVQSKLLLIQ